MKSFFKVLWISIFLFSIVLTGCNVSSVSEESQSCEKVHIIESPKVSYPLPVVDYIENNSDEIKKRSINDNPIVYILRGINDIWKGTTDTYQNASSGNGPEKDDCEKSNPIIDSVIWRENIQYVINATQNRTNEEAILAYLDENRAKYYSVIDGLGPLTEDYVEYSGAYVDLPQITCKQVLENTHYQCAFNDNFKFAGDENSTLGAVVRLSRAFRNSNSSSNGIKYLYSTPRPWRMNDDGVVNFLGTTYDSINKKPTYSCINHYGEEIFKIFDLYESSVKIVPGLICSRKNHKKIYDDNNPSTKDLYTNTTENRRTDNAYPSGHTNAGFLSALAYAYAFPERFNELVYRGSQLGESRIVAGMHSPVDVIGGKIMALSIACAALNQPDIAANAEIAVSEMYNFFGAKADSANLSLYEFAHSKVDNPTGYINRDMVNIEVFNNNYYDDREKNKEIYRFRLTYGFPQDTTKANQPPIVPKGAEAILKSRFPYLSEMQRRAVLYTTEIPSGYKITDKTNGWGRIDLLSAADGYGSFIGNVSVNMDASLGRFHALDSWRNDINGDGCLRKRGTGKLILTGNNSYSGGTQIVNGTLATSSTSALGSGNVTLEEKGTLEIINPLHIQGELKLAGGTILLHVDSNNTTQITVDGKTKIENSTLFVTFNESIEVKSGEQFAVLLADNISGSFTNIRAGNRNITTKVISNTLYIIVE